jgi:large subunit ribosomal protein L16
MLQPKRQKFRKQFRKGATAITEKGSKLAFGEYGIKAMTSGEVSEKQLEAARRTIAFFTRKGGKIWVRVFPDKPITKKAAGTRMGSGKGDVVGFVVPVTAGKILFEIGGIGAIEAKEAVRQAGHKIPLRTRYVSKTI